MWKLTLCSTGDGLDSGGCQWPSAEGPPKENRQVADYVAYLTIRRGACPPWGLGLELVVSADGINHDAWSGWRLWVPAPSRHCFHPALGGEVRLHGCSAGLTGIRQGLACGATAVSVQPRLSVFLVPSAPYSWGSVGTTAPPPAPVGSYLSIYPFQEGLCVPQCPFPSDALEWCGFTTLPPRSPCHSSRTFFRRKLTWGWGWGGANVSGKLPSPPL